MRSNFKWISPESCSMFVISNFRQSLKDESVETIKHSHLTRFEKRFNMNGEGGTNKWNFVLSNIRRLWNFRNLQNLKRPRRGARGGRNEIFKIQGNKNCCYRRNTGGDLIVGEWITFFYRVCHAWLLSNSRVFKQ